MQRYVKVGILLFFWILGVGCTPRQEAPRNVILFIGDGFGPAYQTMGREYAGKPLPLDSILVGSMQTKSTSNRVTDSAAGATAFSTGVKTYNGAIAVDTSRHPRATLLEAAEQRGMATGLVATSRITHATPAAFAAHVDSRAREEEIAAQMLEHGIEVIFGGGQMYFLPDTAGGRRHDGRNLLAEARQKGYTVITERAAWDTLSSAPAIALFTPSHMSYEIDRDSTREPSLAEMTRKALDLLRKQSDRGFFLMVEGSRIDHAGHVHDPAAAVREVLAFNEAIAVALAFARQDGHTLIVSTADHETGGLSLGREIDGQSIYNWYPEVLKRIRMSIGALAAHTQTLQDARRLLAESGITDLTPEEVQALAEHIGQRASLAEVYGQIISRRALIGWTTHGHTGVDVLVYATGPGATLFHGFQDNTHIGRGIAQLWGVDLDALTKQLFPQERP